MSDALYPTRLYWSAGRGLARFRGHEVRLAQPPHLPGLQLEEIDYAPGIIAQVMPLREGRRDMEPHEREAALKALCELTESARPPW
jgi:hypothetical protein